MTMTERLDKHLEDGLLVRLLDAATEPGDRGAATHLAECVSCADRLRLLNRRAQRLRTVLQRSDAPVPASLQLPKAASHASHPWIRIAAGVVLVCALGALGTPARAWISDWLGDHWPRSSRTTERQLPPPVTPPVAPLSSTRVRFLPAGNALVLKFARSQRAGALLLLPAPGAEVVVEAEKAGSAELVLLPGEVRVVNQSSGGSSYRLWLPRGVERIRVQVGKRPAREFTPPRSGEEFIPLQ
jgi:hypothetical protein